MTTPLRRSVLSVPGIELTKITKALDSAADEVVVDLEDSVTVGLKDGARAALVDLRPRAKGGVAVRVNGVTTPWFAADLAASAANPAIGSVVVPKVESVDQMGIIVDRLDEAERACGRATPLAVQTLIESAAGVLNCADIAASSPRVVALVLGYADLAASLGRHPSGPWQFAQDAVLMAARAADVQAIDGPLLTVSADESLLASAAQAEAMGFDGKWVIHPRQINTVTNAFVPDPDALLEARELLEAMAAASAHGDGAVQWRGRMLDEAVAAQARRLVQRGGLS